MKSDEELIKGHTGAMSRGVMRHKLDMLYGNRDRIDHEMRTGGLELDEFYDVPTERGVKMYNDWNDICREIQRLLDTGSSRKYGNMTMQQIGEKWDSLDQRDRIDMVEFLPHYDYQIGHIEAGPAARDIYDYIMSYWDMLDDKVKSRFALYAKCNSKKTMEVVV